MTRFIALPVSSGDSFYLERDNFSVLVDGGKSRKKLPKIFFEHTKKKKVDILVCTHNDSDHSNGIIGFLGAGYECKELWLPGMWKDTLDNLMKPEIDIFTDIIRGARQFFEGSQKDRELHLFSLEEIGNEIHNQLLNNEDYRESPDNEDYRDSPDNENSDENSNERILPDEEWESLIRNYIFASEDFDDILDGYSSYYKYYGLPFSRRLDNKMFAISHEISRIEDEYPDAFEVINQAFEAAKNIRRIALLAYLRRIPVRWIKYDPHKPSGKIDKNLYVLSGKHSLAGSAGKAIFNFMYMTNTFTSTALTTVNIESLVLYSPADGNSPGVLFCADSDLRNITLPIKKNDLITVPHHGSQANNKAYDYINNRMGGDFDSLVWVRSDHLNDDRPCPAYKDLQAIKYCTLCPPNKRNQTVEINGINGLWQQRQGVIKCLCI